MKQWIINFFGGFSEREVNELMQKCEEFAVENLQPKNGAISPDATFYIPFDGDDICVIRSRITIMNGRVSGLRFAPWCRNVVAQGINFVQPNS